MFYRFELMVFMSMLIFIPCSVDHLLISVSLITRLPFEIVACFFPFFSQLFWKQLYNQLICLWPVGIFKKLYVYLQFVCIGPDKLYLGNGQLMLLLHLVLRD